MENVKSISMKWLAKNLISKFSILNIVKIYSSGVFENHLVYIPAKSYNIYFGDTAWINLWKSTGISKEFIEYITKSDSNLGSTIVDHHI